MNLEPPFYRCVAPLTRPICKNLPKRFVSQPQLPKCIFNSEMKPFVSQGLLENPKEKTTFLSKKLEGRPPTHPSNSMKTFTFYKRRKWNSIHKNQICHWVWKSSKKVSLYYILALFGTKISHTIKKKKYISLPSKETFLVIFKHCDGWLH